jgi:hypothetical protein
MRILINSDVLYPTSPMITLPQWLSTLAATCAQHGHTIVIPETALLEFNRRQEELVDTAERDLKGAYAVLDQYGLQHQDPEPGDVVKVADLPALLSSLGVAVEVDVPTLADYQEAHRRACLHESPQPPDTKSDEMRDLIIWATAIRHARNDGGAILLSRDTVHVHPRGDDEATQVALVRLKTTNDLLEFLGVQTPAGRQIESLLAPAWAALRSAGVPVGTAPTLISVISPAFVQGTEGLSSASCKLKVRVDDSAVLSGSAQFDFPGNKLEKVTLTDLRIGSGPLLESQSVEVESPLNPTPGEFQDRMKYLIELLEEN